MSAETQALTQISELLKVLNDLGFVVIVGITGLVAAVAVLLWVYFGRNRGRGADAIQQSIASVTTAMATDLKDKVREQSEIAENVARITAGAMEFLAIMRPESSDTNTRVQNIQTDVAQIHTDLSTKEHSVEALLARIADTTEQNNGLLNTLNQNVRETHDQLQRLANNRDLRPDIENLRAAIQAFTAVIADVKDTQDKLVNSANHIAKQTTGEHAAVVVAKEEAA